METKLTLKLDQTVIETAKVYAQKRKRSLSRLVEDYFKILALEDKTEPHYSPLVMELSGILAAVDVSAMDDEYVSYLTDKYK